MPPIVPTPMKPEAGENAKVVTIPILSYLDGKLLKTVADGKCTIFTALLASAEHIASISDVGLNFSSVISVVKFETILAGFGDFLANTSS